MGCPVADVINHAKFQLDRFMGFRAPDGRKSLSPIDLRHHPYNSYALPCYTVIRDNVISATAGLVYINLQPEYELPSSTRFGQFQKFGKFQLGHCPPQLPLTKIGTGCEFLFVAAFASDLTFLSSVTLEI